jgi:hypothetical protein
MDGRAGDFSFKIWTGVISLASLSHRIVLNHSNDCTMPLIGGPTWRSPWRTCTEASQERVFVWIYQHRLFWTTALEKFLEAQKLYRLHVE